MIISVIFILLIILGIGLPLVLLILPKEESVGVLGLSFLLGIGLFTLVMFISNILGLRFSLLNESILLFAILLPLTFVTRKRITTYFVMTIRKAKMAQFSPFEKVILAIIVFAVLSSFLNTFYWPVHIWDSLVLYDFRGKVFATTGFMKEAFIDNYYYGYPLLTSLAHSIIYLGGGKYPQFLYSLFYLSLGTTFYGLLKEFVSRKIALLFTMFLLIIQPLFYNSLISYTNFPYTVYMALGSIYVYLWDKKKQKGYLIISALLAGLSTWTRSVEPFWLAILLIVFLVSIYRKRFFDIILFSLIFFPIHEIWKTFQNSLMTSGSSTVGDVISYTKILLALFNVEKWIQIAGYLYKYVVVPWGAIFPVFIVATTSLFFLNKQKKLFLIFFITFTLLSVLIAGTFSFSLSFSGWYAIGDAVQRMSMLFYPLFIYCTALVAEEMAKAEK
jgi:hypothetical protein